MSQRFTNLREKKMRKTPAEIIKKFQKSYYQKPFNHMVTVTTPGIRPVKLGMDSHKLGLTRNEVH